MPPHDAPSHAALDQAELAAYWLPFTANRAFKRRPRLIDRAAGMHYFTPDGRQLLDAMSGLWCCNAGHCREPIVEAIRRQAGRFDYAPAVHGLKGAPHIVDIRTIGLAAGIDLAPVDGAPGLRGARAFDAAFFDEDVMIRVVGDTLVLAPALIASEANIEAITGKVGRMFKGLR